jgi:hypothetical protein
MIPMATKFLFIWTSDLEVNIKMWKVNGRRMPSDDKSWHFHWQGELKTWCKKKYSYNILKFIFDMGVNQDLISVLIRINPDIW